MLIKLTVSDRIRILSILPKQGNFVTAKTLKKLNDSIGFQPEEIELFGLKEHNGIVSWNNEGNTEKEFQFVDFEAEIIRKELRKMDTEGTITLDMIPVYEKFMC